MPLPELGLPPVTLQLAFVGWLVPVRENVVEPGTVKEDGFEEHESGGGGGLGTVTAQDAELYPGALTFAV